MKRENTDELGLFPKEEPPEEEEPTGPKPPAPKPTDKLQGVPSGPLPPGTTQSIKGQIRIHLEEMDDIHLREVLLLCQHLLDQEKF